MHREKYNQSTFVSSDAGYAERSTRLNGSTIPHPATIQPVSSNKSTPIPDNIVPKGRFDPPWSSFSAISLGLRRTIWEDRVYYGYRR
jgi:hypothetical protein